MNVEDLKLITRSNTADIILKHFAQRERINNETTLDAFRAYLIRQGKQVDVTQLQKLFEELEEAGVGELVALNGTKHGRFLWYYSLRDISEQILNLNKKVEIKAIDRSEVINKKRPRGRPVGYSPKAKVDIKPGLTNALFLFTTDSGDPIALRMSEAERLVKQIGILKEKLG